MFGRKKKDFQSSATAPNCGSKHDFLTAGQKYRVVREFQDYDRQLHPEGEEWVFLRSSFLPYDDGMSWFVSIDGEHEWQIRLQ